ncbi:MAG: DNA-directed RNA polymerase subunit E'' [Candidatus Thermoplasmatota archaeon]|nr:DNA-directed RNA polymerase subunit E'' [Candidatus Thermoplasmatota archaeon]
MAGKSTKKRTMACKTCKKIYMDSPCPQHGDGRMSVEWFGFLIINDTENSIIAKTAGIGELGRYAIKVR